MQEAHIRLRTARIANGYSNAKAFAEEKKLSYHTYIGHENGKKPLSRDAALNYAKLLNISSEWLLHGDSEESDTPHEFVPLRVKALEPLLLPFSIEAILKAVDQHNPNVDYQKLIDCAKDMLAEIMEKTDNVDKIKSIFMTITAMHKDELKHSILKKTTAHLS